LLGGIQRCTRGFLREGFDLARRHLFGGLVLDCGKRRGGHPARNVDVPFLEDRLFEVLESQLRLARSELGRLSRLALRADLGAQLSNPRLECAHGRVLAFVRVALVVVVASRAFLVAQPQRQIPLGVLRRPIQRDAPRFRRLDLRLAAPDPLLCLLRALAGARKRGAQLIALLDAVLVRHAALGDDRLVSRKLTRGRTDAKQQRIEPSLALAPFDLGGIERRGEPSQLRSDGFGFAHQLGAFRGAALSRLTHRLVPLPRPLQVLFVVGHRQRRGVIPIAQVLEVIVRLRARRLRFRVFGFQSGDLGVEPLDLRREVADLAHASQCTRSRGVAPAREQTVAREHVALRRHERAGEPVHAVDAHGLGQIPDQIDAREQRSRDSFESAARANPGQQRLAERHEALGRCVARNEEQTAAGLPLS
jgi:hypothetical protein